MSDWFDEGGSRSPVDVAAVLDSQIHDAVCAMVQAGAMISLFTSSDGGALGVSVTLDGRSRREYGRDPEDFMDFLAGAVEAIRATQARRDRSPRRRSRPRGD